MNTKMSKLLMFVVMLAMAVSVMSMSAWADDDPSYFTLTIARSQDDTHSAVSDTEDDAPADYADNEVVKYDIKLAATQDALTAANTADVDLALSAFQFSVIMTDSNNVLSAPTVTIANDTDDETHEATVTEIGSSGNYDVQFDVAYNGGDNITFSNGDAVTIGTIQFTTIAPNSAVTTGGFWIFNATAHVALQDDTAAHPVTTSNVTGSVKVHPTYTITLKKPTWDNNGMITGTSEAIMNNGNPWIIEYTFSSSSGASIAAQNNHKGSDDTTDTYAFAGWAPSDNTGTSWNENIATTSAYSIPAYSYGNVTLTAIYNPVTFTATFDYNIPALSDVVQSNTTDEYNVGIDTVSMANVPTVNGYTFQGWYVNTGDDGGSWVADPTTLITGDLSHNFGDVKFTAKWTKTPAQASFDLGYTTNDTINNISYDIEDTDLFSTLSNPTRPGYTFDGWAVDANHAGGWDTSMKYGNNPVANGPYVAFPDHQYGYVTFIATWDANTYNVTLNAGSHGTLAGINSMTYRTNTAFTPTAPTAQSGWQFVGWYVTEATGNDSYPNDGTPSNTWPTITYADAAPTLNSGGTYYGDITLTAHYTHIQYTAQFYMSDTDTVPMTGGTVTFYVDDNIVWPTDPTNRGSDFGGWKVKTTTGNWAAVGVEYGTATGQTARPTANMYGNVDFVAIWKEHTYTVSYELVNGTAGATAPGTYTYSDQLTVSDPSKTGYTFTGWTVTAASEDITGEGTAWSTSDAKYTSLSTGTTGKYGNVTLTANWDINGKFLSYDYQFSNNQQLVLLAVKTDGELGADSNTTKGVYSYSAGGSSYAVYKDNQYVALFTDITADDQSNWTVYATIAPSGGVQNNFAFEVDLEENAAVTVNGDINGVGNVDVGDYGTVGEMLMARESYTNVGVDGRLKVDMDTSDFANAATTGIGNIQDLWKMMQAAKTAVSAGG